MMTRVRNDVQVVRGVVHDAGPDDRTVGSLHPAHDDARSDQCERKSNDGVENFTFRRVEMARRHDVAGARRNDLIIFG